MGRPSKPTNVHELSGAFKKNPQRRAEREGEPIQEKALGNPPEHLSPDARKAWADLEKQAPPGVLTYTDRAWMEITSILFGRFRAMPERMKAADINTLTTMLAKIGFNPSDRTRLKVEASAQVEKKNEFSDF